MKSLIIILAFVLCAWSSESVAFIKSVQNNVLVKRDGASHPAKIGEYLFNGDTIQTGKNTNTGLSFNDGTRIAIGPESEFVINDYLFHPSKKDFKFNVALPKGTMVFESGKIGKLAPEKVTIKVPQGIIGIRGTKFVVDAE